MWPETIYAPTLNATLTGVDVLHGNVVQYRGIKYASIAKRFAFPVPVDTFGGRSLDCTKLPSVCPEQPLLDFERVFLAIPETEDVPQLQDWQQDELECANLIVSVPTTVTQDARLPVFIWIHGGAFIHASANRRSEDLAGLVDFSAKVGKPMIGVALNFRHHVVGFSTVRGVGNYGLRDQRAGIEWVNKHIIDFGGDPSRVTLAGNSSGAVSVHSHLCSAPEGLFQRAVMFSSTLNTMEPRTIEQQSHMTKALCKRLGIPWTTGWEDKLEEIPISLLTDAYVSMGTNAMYPTADDGFYGDGGPPNSEHVPSWCEALMIGGNRDESSLWRWAICSYTTERIISLVRSSTNALIADKLLSIYDFGCPSDKDEDTQAKALRFINDGMFLLPLEKMTLKWRSCQKQVFEFLLDEDHPYMPEWGATHDEVLFYALGPFDTGTYRNKTAHRVQRVFQQALVEFLYGDSPWRSTKKFAFGPMGICGELESGEHSERRRLKNCGVLEELDKDEVAKVMDALIRGASRQPRVTNAKL